MSTVLVIDDDPEFQEAITRMLTDAGYEILRADDGTAGMHLLERRHATIDLAIVDLSLPGINGFEIIGAVARRPSGIKVIATTGLYGEPHLEAAGSLGAHAVIRKPAPGKKLRDKDWVSTVEKLIGPANRGKRASVGGNTGTPPTVNPESDQ